MRTDDFDFDFPENLIALSPAPRGTSRLVTVTRGPQGNPGVTPHVLTWGSVADLPQWLRPGDALVLNDTKVLKARLRGQTPQGGQYEALLLKPVDAIPGMVGHSRIEGELRAGHELQPEMSHTGFQQSRWEAMVKPGKRFRVGDKLQFQNSSANTSITPIHTAPGLSNATTLHAEVVAIAPDGTRTLAFSMPPWELLAALERFGEVPLPPYIDRAVTADDEERYQSVFAKNPGSVAAPTASLHFDEAMLASLEKAGIHLIHVTLHVGSGTFKPVETEHIADHPMHSEYYHLSEEAAAKVAAVKQAGGRIIAVGTTAARVLESCSSMNAEGFSIAAGAGETRLFISPGYHWKCVDGLLTNFHWPKSTLFMLVTSLLGVKEAKSIYTEAMQNGFRLFSYGDAMLIL